VSPTVTVTLNSQAPTTDAMWSQPWTLFASEIAMETMASTAITVMASVPAQRTANRHVNPQALRRRGGTALPLSQVSGWARPGGRFASVMRPIVVGRGGPLVMEPRKGSPSPRLPPMRIVVSGTHASGKSTLIADFQARHPGFTVLPDPFELVDAAYDEPDAGVFWQQLRIAAARLEEFGPGDRVIAERGPLDFLAYLTALEALGRPGRSAEAIRRGYPVTAAAMDGVDLLVLLPLSARHPIPAPEDEDPELREAMDEALLELSDDPDLVGEGTVVAELVGDAETRVAELAALAGL
jgi:hypothetical protein